ncbi:expressed unknown protein [Seminavis robusta]|uniref:Uncharacterized protein n=1 Tax=Seminavis robusta TaxID=568900 RepID=A0A9N8EEN6_9STRA|nr:expressed unknown protein [Seminavis robusta]|eukprot:Sro1072_g238080.1 n/a (527) ;mRNA; r:15340-17039
MIVTWKGLLLTLVHSVAAIRGANSRRDPPLFDLLDDQRPLARHLEELGPGFKQTFNFSATENRTMFGARTAISADGTVVALAGDGFVEVYEQVSGDSFDDWRLRAVRIATTSGTLPKAIDLSPDGMIVAIGQPDWNSARGRTDIYAYNTTDNTWTDIGSWSGSDPNYKVGYSLAFHKPAPNALGHYGNGDTLALGIPGFELVGDPGFEYPLGEVYLLFRNQTSGRYFLSEEVRGKSLTGSADQGRVDFLAFGSTVALGGTGEYVLAVGIDTFNTELRPGRVVVLVSPLNTEGQFNLLGSEIVGEGGGDGFGSSIALNQFGTIIAIGGPLNDGRNFIMAGHVEVYSYKRGLDEFWVQLGGDIDGFTFNEQFGFSVALDYDGDTLLIGAPFFGGGTTGFGDDAGYATVLEYNRNSDAWFFVQINRDENPLTLEGSEGSRLGHGVAMSANGAKLLVGIPFGTNQQGVVSGTAELWQNTMYPTFSPINNRLPEYNPNGSGSLAGGVYWVTSNVSRAWNSGVAFIQSVFGV